MPLPVMAEFLAERSLQSIELSTKELFIGAKQLYLRNSTIESRARGFPAPSLSRHLPTWAVNAVEPSSTGMFFAGFPGSFTEESTLFRGVRQSLGGIEKGAGPLGGSDR